jgi:soluble P-type ATPase
MLEEKEIKIPIASTDTTSGLVSVMQLLDTTPGEIFATIKNDTSEIEIQRIIYPSMELPKKE